MGILTLADLEAALAKSKYQPDIRSRLIGYARVSTEEQSLEMQLAALRRAGIEDDDLFSEQVSGVAKRRPRLEAAKKRLRAGDTLVVWQLDRLGRSVKDLLAHLEWMAARGVGFRSLTENFDTTTPIGQLYIHLAAAFAEFERQLISHRTRTGVRAAMERGVKMGAPRKIDAARAEAMLRRGKTVGEVALALGVSRPTIYNYFDGATITRLRQQGPRPAKRKT